MSKKKGREFKQTLSNEHIDKNYYGNYLPKVEALKAKWSAKGRESCRLGTRMHECCEDIELGRELRNKAENEIEQMRFNNAIKMAKAFRQKLDIIGVEKLVFDDRL